MIAFLYAMVVLKSYKRNMNFAFMGVKRNINISLIK